MISKQMDMSERSAELGAEKKELIARIRELKKCGRLIETRPYVRPHIDKKRTRRFVLVAVSQDMFAA